MPTKTISIDLDAYALLAAARTKADESFSRVIKRAIWQQEKKTCGSLLAALSSMSTASEEALLKMETAQQTDAPPDDSWK